MAYKRAEWHSGLTYSQVCEQCKTKNTYNDYKLDFRPWYADGFVYCTNCRTPLRHREEYAIDGPEKTEPRVEAVQPQSAVRAAFCTKCGRAFCEGENFCPNCGNKRLN